MPVKDLKTGTTQIELFTAASRTAATVNGTGVDLGKKRPTRVLMIVSAGTVATSLDVKLQDSNDNGVADAYADVTGGAITQLTAAGFSVLEVKNTKRWIRAVYTTGGTCVFAVVALGGNLGLRGASTGI